MPAERMVDLRKGYYEAIASLQTGTYKGSGDVIDWSFYDRFTLLSTVLEHQMFSVGIGQVDPVTAVRKTLADTNMIGTQIVPQGAKHYVRAIKEFYQAFATRTEAQVLNIYNLLTESVLNVSIFGKATYGQWGLDEIMGLCTAVNGVAATSGSLLSTGRYVGILPLNLPLVIASQVQFNLDVREFTASAAAIDSDKVKISLPGILERLS